MSKTKLAGLAALALATAAAIGVPLGLHQTQPPSPSPPMMPPITEPLHDVIPLDLGEITEQIPPDWLENP